MADKTGRHGIVAFQKGTTWGTAVAPGALDGVLPFSISPWPLQGDPVIDDTIGNWDEVQEMTKLIEEANPTIIYPYRREGAFLRHVAHIFGDDTPTSGNGQKTHTFNWQQESALFGTYAAEIADADITEWPSMKTTGITLRKGGDGGLELEARTICDTVQVAADATTAGGDFDAVTYDTKVKRVANNEVQFRINAQAGAALASPGDVIKLGDFSLDINRPYDREDVTRGASTGVEFQTDEPIQNGPAEILLSVTANDYTTIALLDDLKDTTEYKADIIITKTISAVVHSDTIQFNRLQPMPQSADIDRMNRIPLTRVFRAKKATSTPTGMTNANVIHWVHLDSVTATYE
jgi:hypothetical protein